MYKRIKVFIWCLILVMGIVSPAMPVLAVNRVEANVSYKDAGRVLTGRQKIIYQKKADKPLYLKYVPAKSGKYRFVIRNICSDNVISGDDIQTGYVQFLRFEKKHLRRQYVKTKYGRVNTVFLESKDAHQTDASRGVITKNRFLPQQYITLTLKKNEPCFIRCFFAEGNNTSFVMTVKYIHK